MADRKPRAQGVSRFRRRRDAGRELAASRQRASVVLGFVAPADLLAVHLAGDVDGFVVVGAASARQVLVVLRERAALIVVVAGDGAMDLPLAVQGTIVSGEGDGASGGQQQGEHQYFHGDYLSGWSGARGAISIS